MKKISFSEIFLYYELLSSSEFFFIKKSTNRGRCFLSGVSILLSGIGSSGSNAVG